MDEKAPNHFGIFDSGIGGLGVLNALIARFPHASFTYIADLAHMPYGARSPDEIKAFTRSIFDYLYHTYHIDAFVSACHTSSVIALPKSVFPVLSIGMDSALVQSLRSLNRSDDKTRGVILTTPATHKKGFYSPSFFTQHTIKGQWKTHPCGGFVPFIEKELFHAPSPKRIGDILEKDIEELRHESLDYIVLGCTHYPLLSSHIHRFFNGHIPLIDPADFAGAMFHGSLHKSLSPPPTLTLLSTMEEEHFYRYSTLLLDADRCARMKVSYGTLSWNQGILSSFDTPFSLKYSQKNARAV